MATAWSDTEENPETNSYNQLWMQALDVDEEVQKILRDHAIVEQTEILEAAEEENHQNLQ